MNEEEDKIASGFDEYVADTNSNYQIEAENVEVTAGETETKKGFSFWFLLLPLLLLIGAGYLLFTLMGKTENPYAKDMPKAKTPTTQIEEKSTPNSEKEETVKTEKEEGLSSNSTASLLQTKEEKKNIKKSEEKKEKVVKATPVETKATNSSEKLANGYYIIIGSIPSKKVALAEAQKWIRKDYPAFVQLLIKSFQTIKPKLFLLPGF